MIVDEDRKLVIITPPHTASGNLHRALCAPPWNCRWVIGPGPDGTWDHHIVHVAPGWEDYRRFLVVRDPMTRLVGLWLHYDYARTQDNYVGPRDLDWPAFVEAVARDDASQLSWFFRWTITRLIESVDRLDGVIRYERLGDDLLELVGDVVLEGAYHDPIDLAEWYGDDRIRDLATAWGQAGRLRFEHSPG